MFPIFKYASSILFCQTVGRPRRAVIHWPKTMFCISAPRMRLGNIPAIKKYKGKKYFNACYLDPVLYPLTLPPGRFARRWRKGASRQSRQPVCFMWYDRPKRRKTVQCFFCTKIPVVLPEEYGVHGRQSRVLPRPPVSRPLLQLAVVVGKHREEAVLALEQATALHRPGFWTEKKKTWHRDLDF